MTLHGKGFYIWQLKNCNKADPDQIAEEARKAGFSHVIIKVANDTNTYNIDKEHNIDLVPPVVRALKANDVRAWGWQYIYGRDPVGEARKAIQRIQGLGLDGFVINAEVQFKEPGKDVAARQYMRELRDTLPDFPIALSSYRYPSYHPQFPFSAFLDKCDINMPQVYWMGAHNPGAQLNRTLREFQNIKPFRPIIPTGYAFAEHAYEPPSPEEINEFLHTAQELRMTAANFWSWDYCFNKLPDIWNTISQYPWASTPPPKDIPQKYIDALNSHDPVKMTVLYSPQAVHINAQRTIQGYERILSWYHQFFTYILPNAQFNLTGFSGVGNSRHVTWTASSPTGQVHNGNDTFGLKEDRIAYHYTFYTIS
jgi:hypothetical protein